MMVGGLGADGLRCLADELVKQPVIGLMDLLIVEQAAGDSFEAGLAGLVEKTRQ